jgi:hypothetical protein
MNGKLNLEVFELAAEQLATDQPGDDFVCISLSKAAMIMGTTRGYSTDLPERRFFEDLYLDKSRNSFNHMNSVSGDPVYDKELQNIRLLALCFTHEIARQENLRLARERRLGRRKRAV